MEVIVVLRLNKFNQFIGIMEITNITHGQELSSINPEYFSVTFGALGTTQEATLETVLDIQENQDRRLLQYGSDCCIAT
jgi:hypothetical protein